MLCMHLQRSDYIHKEYSPTYNKAVVPGQFIGVAHDPADWGPAGPIFAVVSHTPNLDAATNCLLPSGFPLGRVVTHSVQ